jgi:hypothetical protein
MSQSVLQRLDALEAIAKSNKITLIDAFNPTEKIIITFNNGEFKINKEVTTTTSQIVVTPLQLIETD